MLGRVMYDFWAQKASCPLDRRRAVCYDKRVKLIAARSLPEGRSCGKSVNPNRFRGGWGSLFAGAYASEDPRPGASRIGSSGAALLPILAQLYARGKTLMILRPIKIL